MKVGEYTFFNKSTKNLKTTWFCSTNYNKGCSACVITVNGKICKKNNEHNHAPFFVDSLLNNTYISASANEKKVVSTKNITYCESIRGALLMKIGDYTFFKKYTKNSKSRWVCSTNHCKGCRASVYTMDDKIYKQNIIHNHQASSMIRMLTMKTFRAVDSENNDSSQSE